MLIANGTVFHEVRPMGTVSVPAPHDYLQERPLSPFVEWLIIAPYVSGQVPALAGIINRLIDRTGWSNRRIAEIVGTTHPTIQAIKGGRHPERKPELAEALFKTAEVVEKISRLAQGSQSTLNAILTSRDNRQGTPLQLLASGEYARAYLQAVDVLHKPRQAGPLLNITQARQPSLDVSLIFDDPGE
ncbi:MAG: hypothetical protein WCD86_09595 [Ktedonobacteraceae bacterium]